MLYIVTAVTATENRKIRVHAGTRHQAITDVWCVARSMGLALTHVDAVLARA